MARPCPYCDAPEREESEEPGVLRCRACGRSSLAGDTAASIAAREGREEPKRPLISTGFSTARADSRSSRRAPRRAPGEVASWPAALAAVLATVVFYSTLALVPDSRISDLFTARGWVPYVITLVSFWALLLLGARWSRLRIESKALERDLVATGEDGRLGPAEIPSALEALRLRSQGVEGSFLVARLERALRHFEARRRVVEVVEFLTAESSADEGRVDASYALVRVFVWAVPTLGFIGTVIGIGAAVGGFSETLEAASSLETMKESIGSVTGGLGVAFDTTLLALVMSILIMFPASAIQRIEESFLGEVEDYCAEQFVGRLRDDEETAPDDGLIEALAVRLVAAMRRVEAEGR